MAGDRPGVAMSGNLMLALLPGLGSRSRVRKAWLKWAGPGPLIVQRSSLGNSDSDHLDDAFGLFPGTSIESPGSLSLADVRERPEPSSWTLNGVTVEPAHPDPHLIVLWLPLIVPGDEVHFVAAVVNGGMELLRLPDLVWDSRLKIDGTSHAFADPGQWDGLAAIRPGSSATLRFRFEQFGANIPDGAALVSFELGEWSSSPVEVEWRQATPEEPQ